MIPPHQLVCFYAGRLLKRIELYFLLSGIVIFLTATRTTDPVSHSVKLGLEEKTDSLVNYALAFQGAPYRYGGKNPEGFDCSGFTRYVFQHVGIQLNASSRTQFTQGKEISMDSIRKGDLVFFHNLKNNINHVGLVIEVALENNDVTFIHASSSQGIRIDSLAHPYYQKRFQGVRRIY